MSPVEKVWPHTHTHTHTHTLKPLTIYSHSTDSLFIWGGGSSFSPEAPHPSPPKTDTHCTNLSPKYTHPSSVPLRLINKSKVLPAVLSQTTICSLWDSRQCCCSSRCLVTSRPGCLASSQSKNCTLVEMQMPNPIACHLVLFACWFHCFLLFLFIYFLQKSNLDEREATEESYGQLG